MSRQQGGEAWRNIGSVKQGGRCHTLRGGKGEVQEKFYYLVPADTSEEAVRVFEGEEARVYIARDKKLHEHGEDSAMRLCTHGGFEPVPGTHWPCTSELCSDAKFTGSCYRNRHDSLGD